MPRTRTFIAAGLAATFAATGAAPASAETIQLRIGAGHPATATWVDTIANFFVPRVTERVAEETDHTLEWTEAWAGSVCRLGECLEAVESGLLDMADLQTPFDPSKLMAQNFSYFVPFGTGDPVLGARLNWETYQEVPELKTMLEEQYNQVFIGVGILGNYGLITNFEWDDPEELRGQRIAAAGPNIPWVEAVGMVPVQSNLNEAYTSMQTGVYTGWVMFPDGATSFRLEEVSRQHTITGFGVIATPLLTMNLQTWESLPPEVQEIFLEVGQEWNEFAGEYTTQRQEEALETFREAGLTVKELTFEEQQAWAANLPNIPRQRYDEINAAGQPGEAVYVYVRLLEEAGHQFPRDWAAERE
jgi:TRAP-type C4-dicarboxylate transport system substrate-binding protein